jgi:hypothetical protein
VVQLQEVLIVLAQKRSMSTTALLRAVVPFINLYAALWQ